jgi:hypothetical protein
MKIKFNNKKTISENKEEVSDEDKVKYLLKIHKAYDLATKARHLHAVSDEYTEDYDKEFRTAAKELNKKHSSHFDVGDFMDFLEDVREKDLIDHDVYSKLRDLFQSMAYESDREFLSKYEPEKHEDEKEEISRYRSAFPKFEIVKERKK